jgi:hypothetical protein
VVPASLLARLARLLPPPLALHATPTVPLALDPASINVRHVLQHLPFSRAEGGAYRHVPSRNISTLLLVRASRAIHHAQVAPVVGPMPAWPVPTPNKY